MGDNVAELAHPARIRDLLLTNAVTSAPIQTRPNGAHKPVMFTLLPNWLPRYATRAHRLASDEPLRAASAPLPYFRSPPSVCRRAISVCAGVLRREVAEGGNADRA